jgi:hypothetical protein
LVIKINSQDTYGKSKYLDWAGAPFYLTPICSMDLRVDREDSLGRQEIELEMLRPCPLFQSNSHFSFLLK